MSFNIQQLSNGPPSPHLVNIGSILPPTSRVTFPHDYVIVVDVHRRASARWAFVVKKYINFILFFRKWQINSLDKTLIPQLGSCRALWSCNLDLQPIGPCWSPLYGEKSWNVFFKNLNFFLTKARKTWGWVNYQEILILEWTNPLTKNPF